MISTSIKIKISRMIAIIISLSGDIMKSHLRAELNNALADRIHRDVDKYIILQKGGAGIQNRTEIIGLETQGNNLYTIPAKIDHPSRFRSSAPHISLCVTKWFPTGEDLVVTIVFVIISSGHTESITFLFV